MVQSGSVKKQHCAKRGSRQSLAGFSLIEVLAVVIITLILATVAIYSFAANRRTVKTVAAYNEAFALFQQARQRAITNRMAYQVTINRSPDATGKINLMNIVDSNNNLIRAEYLPQDVNITKPAGLPLIGAPTPNTVADAVFDAPFPGGKLVLFFNVDGTVTTGAAGVGGNPFTGGIFFSDTVNNPNLTRALSIYSSTGETKFWYYNGAQFVSNFLNF